MLEDDVRIEDLCTYVAQKLGGIHRSISSSLVRGCTIHFNKDVSRQEVSDCIAAFLKSAEGGLNPKTRPDNLLIMYTDEQYDHFVHVHFETSLEYVQDVSITVNSLLKK